MKLSISLTAKIPEGAEVPFASCHGVVLEQDGKPADKAKPVSVSFNVNGAEGDALCAMYKLFASKRQSPIVALECAGIGAVAETVKATGKLRTWAGVACYPLLGDITLKAITGSEPMPTASVADSLFETGTSVLKALGIEA